MCDAQKLIVIRNALDPSLPPVGTRGEARRRLNLPAAELVVGMVARLAPQKGVGRFVQAAVLVLKQVPEATFVLVGGGPLEAELRTRVEKLGPIHRPERFRIEGHREDAHELYRAFDVLALSSLYEGLPYVLLEAMAQGVPIVATDVLGTNDVVVDGETGLFSPALNDETHIASANHARAHRSRTARAPVQRLHWNACAPRFSFDDFIQGHRALYRPDAL